MGKFSRDKGIRAELSLRNYLRSLGWFSERVPLSGASNAFQGKLKGDVRASKDGKELKFESKCSKSGFNRLYQLYEEHCKLGDDLISIAVPGNEHLCLNISTSLQAVLENAEYYTIISNHPLYSKFKATFEKKIRGLEKLIGKSDILVLKGDYKPFIFVRFPNAKTKN